ncbi:MAG: AAA family ATPase [Anaerolineales bacterium]|nr:AAA family ATPase [Anaerolineales bacterium]
MQLRRILLKNFRRFPRFKRNFTGGFNLVMGPNESGKSTLQDAIVQGLLDRPTGKKAEMKHKAWDSDRMYEIEIQYILPGGLEYTIRKDYEKGSHEVIGPDGSDDSREGLERAVEEALGTTSQALFLNTACIRQDDMDILGGGQDEIASRLQQIVMGGVTGVDQVIVSLKQKISDYERGWMTSAPKNPGPVKVLQNEIDEVEDQIQEISAGVEKREGARDELSEAREMASENSEKLGTRKDAIESHERRLELKEKLEDQNRIENELQDKLDRLNQAEVMIKAAETDLQELSGLSALDDEKKDALQNAYEEQRTRSVEVAEQEKLLSELETQVEEVPGVKKRSYLGPIILIILGLITGIAGALPFLIPDLIYDPSLGLILLFLGGALTTAGLVWFLFLGLSNRRTFGIQGQVQTAQARYKQGQKALGQADEELQGLLEPTGCDSWESYQEGLVRYQHLEGERAKAEVARDAILGPDVTPEELREQRRQLSRERRDTEEELEEIASVPEMKALEYAKLRSEVHNLEEELKKTQELIVRLEALSEVEGPSLEALYRLQEREDALRRRLDLEVERHEVYKLTLDGIQQARDETMRNAQEALTPQLNTYLERLTGGRYTQAVVGEDLTIQVLHPDKGDEAIGMDELSLGTQDQVYLAARLALIDLIFQGAQPPLLMDDPFVKFDPERRVAALELCQDLAADRQIILFTCHEHHEHYADHVIALE